MATPKIVYKQNSQYLQIAGLKDQSVTPNVYLNSATVTATLKDSTGAAVPGFTNVTGTYVTSSNGTYVFPVDPTTFNPTAGSGYTIFVVAIQSGKQFECELPAKVQVRNLGTET